MDVTTANRLAKDMTKRLTLCTDFWTTCQEFDRYKGTEEYDYALKQAVMQRLPFEDETWRRDAVERLGLA